MIAQNETFTVLSDSHPNDGWTLERLGAFAANQFTTSGDVEANVGLLVRRSTVAFFRAGHALSLARAKLKETGRWVMWQEAHGLARTTVFEAITLYTNAKTEDAVADLRLSQARKLFGVSTAKPRDQKEFKEAKIRKEKPTGRYVNPNCPLTRCRTAAFVLDDVEAVLNNVEVVSDELRAMVAALVEKASAMEQKILARFSGTVKPIEAIKSEEPESTAKLL